jgi:hypothetical protein
MIFFYACRLLQNYTVSGNSILQKTIYGHYQNSVAVSNSLSASRFGVLLNKLFDLKKHVIYINSVKHFRYTGIDLLQSVDIENVRPFPSSDSEIANFSSEHGYQCRRKGNSLIFYHVTPLECDGVPLSKEVHLDLEQNSVTVKVRRQCLVDNMLPKTCTTWNELRFILDHVREASVCVGYNVFNGDGENWTLADGSNIQTRRSPQCYGTMGRTKTLCPKCIIHRIKNNTATSPEYHNHDHTYAMNPNPKTVGYSADGGEEEEEEDEICVEVRSVGNSEEDMIVDVDSEDEQSTIESDDPSDCTNDPTYSPSTKVHRIEPKPTNKPLDIKSLIDNLPPSLKTNDAFIELLTSQALNA